MGRVLFAQVPHHFLFFFHLNIFISHCFFYSFASSSGTLQEVRDESNNVLVFPANSDSDSVVTNVLPQPIRARVLRLAVVTFEWWPALRWDVTGCNLDGTMGKTKVSLKPPKSESHCILNSLLQRQMATLRLEEKDFGGVRAIQSEKFTEFVKL